MYADSPGCPGNKYVHNLIVHYRVDVIQSLLQKKRNEPKVGEKKNILGLSLVYNDAGCIVGL